MKVSMKEFVSDPFYRSWLGGIMLFSAIVLGCYADYGINSGDHIAKTNAITLILLYAGLFAAAGFLITRHLLKAMLFLIGFAVIEMAAVLLLAQLGIIQYPAFVVYSVSIAMNAAFAIFYILCAIVGDATLQFFYRLLTKIDLKHEQRKPAHEAA